MTGRFYVLLTIETLLKSSIPTDTRQFGFKHLLFVMASIAFAGGIYSVDKYIGILLFGDFVAFWTGCGLLVVSDIIDHRPVDERGGLVRY